MCVCMRNNVIIIIISEIVINDRSFETRRENRAKETWISRFFTGTNAFSRVSGLVNITRDVVT